MAITVVTPAAETNLVEPQRVELEVPGLSADLRDAIIAEVSDTIDSHLGRRLCRQRYSETLPGFGGLYLHVMHSPLVLVDSVLHNSSPITDHVISDEEAGELFREDGWTWTAARAWQLTGFRPPGSEQPNFTIVYDAGYLLPGENGRTLPQTIERAAIEFIRAIASAPDPNVASKRLGDWSVTYRSGDDAGSMIPPRSRMLLEPYRRAA